jgi:hypothetical protein
MNNQKLPEWFDGTIYNEGDTLINPETNEELEISNVELSIHDFVMGSEMIIEMMGNKSPKDLIKYRDEGLKWLKNSNPKIIEFINLS